MEVDNSIGNLLDTDVEPVAYPLKEYTIRKI
jgi:hypothetical protein